MCARNLALALALVLLPSACGQGQQQSGVGSQEHRISILEDNRRITGDIESLGQRIDDKEWEGVRRHFAERVIIRLGNRATPTASLANDETVSADELVGRWERALPQNVRSFHTFGVPIVNVQGDVATAVVNGHVWNSPLFANSMGEVRGRFEFVLVRQGRYWKISEVNLEQIA